MLIKITWIGLMLGCCAALGCANSSDDGDPDTDCHTECDNASADCRLDCDEDDQACGLDCDAERDDCETDCD